MKKTAQLLFLFVLAFSLCQCNSESTSNANESESENTSESAETEETVEDQSGTCAGNSIAMTTDNKYIKDAGADQANLSNIVFAKAFMNANVSNSHTSVYISNVEMEGEKDGELIKYDLPKKTLALAFSLVIDGKGGTMTDPIPTQKGKYDFNANGPDDAAQRSSLQILVPGKKIVRMLKGKMEVAEVEVTHVDKEKICGTYHLKDKFTELKGSFEAPYASRNFRK